MPAQVDRFSDALRHRLNAMGSCLESFRSHVEVLLDQNENELRREHGDARRNIVERRRRLEQLHARLKAGADRKFTETRPAVSEWKTNREVRRLNARADHAEAFAADAIDFAIAAIDEVADAMVDAVLARMDADGVQ